MVDRPMLANSAATLPRGHVLVEPSLYDVTSAHADGFGSLVLDPDTPAIRFDSGPGEAFGFAPAVAINYVR